MLRTCCVHKLFFVLTFRTIYVHNMFWAWNFHVLNSLFNEQSFVILWVSWCKNKCFWQIFTCRYLFKPGEVRADGPWKSPLWICIFITYAKQCFSLLATYHELHDAKIPNSLQPKTTPKTQIHLKCQKILFCCKTKRLINEKLRISEAQSDKKCAENAAKIHTPNTPQSNSANLPNQSVIRATYYSTRCVA